MTNEEFLDFDISIFYEKGYEEELKYMGALTAYIVACTQNTQANYEHAEANGTAVQPNKWRGWFRTEKTLRNLLSVSKTGRINPSHPKANAFIQRYEALCKSFLKAYDEQYSVIASDDDTKSKYYTANLCKQVAEQIYSKTEEQSIKLDTIMEAGFVDLRLPFCYSLDSNQRFRQNEYSYDMESLSDSFSNTLAEFTSRLNPTASTFETRTKK